MVSHIQYDKIMETRCCRCNARFRITSEQLKMASGKVQCGECDAVFNASSTLKPFTGDTTARIRRRPEPRPSALPQQAGEELSLHEAMYGDGRAAFTHFPPLLWFIGILLLLVLGIAQVIYYQRYQLISNERYQQQILQICEFLPCAESEFSSTRQIKLLERNVFTHPVKSNALMVTGSFVNEAPFPQKPPKLLVSLLDIQGNLIANRQFSAAEYLPAEQSLSALNSNKPIQFRLEIVDPGTEALTYEFEFL